MKCSMTVSALIFVVPAMMVLGFVASRASADEGDEQGQVALTAANLGAAQKEGRRIFQQKCAVCHVPAWRGATTLGPGLSNETIKVQGEIAVQDAITNGLYDELDKMPGFKYTLTSEQIRNIIDYLKTLDQPPETVASERPER